MEYLRLVYIYFIKCIISWSRYIRACTLYCMHFYRISSVTYWRMIEMTRCHKLWFWVSSFCNHERLLPDVKFRVYLFHLPQNFLKQIKSMGLMDSYNSNLALHAKMVTALSFVPNDDTDRHVDVLATALPWELVPLLNWLANNYIGRPQRRGNGRRQPLFPTEMWNMY